MVTTELERPGLRAPDPEQAAASLDALDGGHEDPVALGQVVRLIAAAASLGAAAVHASAIAQHTADAFHAFTFIGMTVFQAWWGYLVLRSTGARVLIAGAVGHGSIVLLWLLSRASGTPGWFPGASGREPVGPKDLAATLLAVAVLAAIDLVSRRDLSARTIRASRAGAAAGAFVLTAALVAAGGSIAAGHVHSDTGHHADRPLHQ